MNLTNLEYFLVAAEELNFTKAAKRLYISQQALSNHIAKLEEYYGVSLFDRGTPLTLTSAGRVLCDSATQVLDTMDDCGRKLQDIKDFRSGRLAVGIPVTRATIMLPSLCSAFHQIFPRLHLEILEYSTTDQMEKALRDGEMDLAIGYTPEDIANIVSVPLYMERYILLAPNQLLDGYFPTGQLEKMRRRPQSIEKFAACSFVAQSETTMGGRIFRQLCAEAKFTPQIVLSTQNILTEINLCVAGLGCCTVPSSFFPQSEGVYKFRGTNIFGQESRSRITVFELNSKIGSAPITIYRLRSKTLTQAGQKFIQLAQEMFVQ